ncbi:TPA: acyltransferase family protein [Streptococcus suis]|nr:acyltransferase family protein [Streptococcus suis]
MDWVDFGKGLSIFLVVLGHVVLGLYESKRFQSDETWLWIFVQSIYIFHIPVFFALSGYFFKPVSSISEFKNYILNKSIQLGIPFIFYNIIQFILQSIGGDSVRDAATLVDLINIYKAPLGVSWFLYVLWGIFFIQGFLSIKIKDYRLLFLLSLLGLLVVNIWPVDLMLPQRVGLWVSVFMFGNVLRHIELPHKKVWLSILFFTVLCYLTIWYYFDFENRISYYLPKMWSLIFFIVVPFSFILFQLYPKGKSFTYFDRYGKDSLVIYILHAPIVSVTRIVLLKIDIDDALIHIFAGLTFGWYASTFGVYLLKKIPYVDFVFYPSKYIKFK